MNNLYKIYFQFLQVVLVQLLGRYVGEGASDQITISVIHKITDVFFAFSSSYNEISSVAQIISSSAREQLIIVN